MIPRVGARRPPAPPTSLPASPHPCGNDPRRRSLVRRGRRQRAGRAPSARLPAATARSAPARHGLFSSDPTEATMTDSTAHASAFATRGYAQPDVLVTTDWVAAHLNDPHVRIVESNDDPLLYPSGHIPG